MRVIKNRLVLPPLVYTILKNILTYRTIGMKVHGILIGLTLIIVTSITAPKAYSAGPNNYSATWAYTDPSPKGAATSASYVLSTTNPTCGGSATSNCYVPAGNAVLITFPAGTNATTFTDGTLNGAAIGAFTNPLPNQLSFNTPGIIDKGEQINIILNGIINPGSGTYTTLVMAITNASTGTNTFNTSDYTICP